MRRLLRDMNPTVRGLLVVALIAAVVVVLWLEATLTALFLIARIAFFLAIAFFIFLVWRERRSDIATWSRRAQAVLYGAVALSGVDLGVYFWRGASGLDAVAFLVVLAIAGFSIWRVWKDQRTYA